MPVSSTVNSRDTGSELLSHDVLRGRVLLLTGTTGIAAATARLAACGGARVWVVGIDSESGDALAAELRGSGAESCFFHANLTVPSAVDAAVAACADQFGGIDALFNVAGISGRGFGDGPVHECTVEAWDLTLETNLKSMFLMCRAVAGRMLGQPIAENGLRGTILNMASVLASSPEPRHFATHAYATSKAAVVGLTRSMAAYYAAHRIRVNAIAPSLVRTPMSQRAQNNEDILKFMETKHPLTEGLIEPESIARAALFLMDDAAHAITGEMLTVDAGWSLT